MPTNTRAGLITHQLNKFINSNQFCVFGALATEERTTVGRQACNKRCGGQKKKWQGRLAEAARERSARKKEKVKGEKKMRKEKKKRKRERRK